MRSRAGSKLRAEGKRERRFSLTKRKKKPEPLQAKRQEQPQAAPPQAPAPAAAAPAPAQEKPAAKAPKQKVRKRVKKTRMVRKKRTCIPNDQKDFDWQACDNLTPEEVMAEFDAMEWDESLAKQELPNKVVREAFDAFVWEMVQKRHGWYAEVEESYEEEEEYSVSETEETEETEEEELEPLEPLPAEVPSLDATEEYKAYMLLRYKHQERENYLLLRAMKKEKRAKEKAEAAAAANK